jgi:hypothetical protein
MQHILVVVLEVGRLDRILLCIRTHPIQQSQNKSAKEVAFQRKIFEKVGFFQLQHSPGR